MLGDDDLDRLLYRARPATPVRGEGLSEAQEALLHRITQDPGGDEPMLTRRRVSRRATEGVTASIVVLMLVLLGTTIGLWSQQSSPALAATPRPLSVQAIDGEAGELLMGLAQDLQGTGAEPPRAVIRFQFWSLAFDPESPPVSMQPQETTIWRTADGGAQLETRALAAQDSDGNPLDGGTAWAAGEVVFQHTFAPGEPIGLFRQPTSDSDWGELLREGDSLETDAGAPAYFRAVSGLLSEHPLSLEKQSDLVKFLATLPEIRVDGKVTDRLGREGVSFSADDGDSRHTLIVSGSLGILAYELLYTGSERTDLRAPAVIDYRAWY